MITFEQQQIKPPVVLNQAMWHVAKRNNAKVKIVRIKRLDGTTVDYVGK